MWGLTEKGITLSKHAGNQLIYEPNQPQALISITQEAKMVPTEPTSGGGERHCTFHRRVVKSPT